MKFNQGDKVKYLESDGWKYGTFDKSIKSKISPEFDTAYVDHVSSYGNKYWKVCFLNELSLYILTDLIMKFQPTIFKISNAHNGKLWPFKIINISDDEGTPFTDTEERSIWNKNWTTLNGTTVGHDPKNGTKRFIELETRGGARKGSGRPKKEKTAVMRIPKSKVKEVKAILKS